MTANQGFSQSISQNSSYANTAFMIGLFSILGAWGFELIGGFIPCELCLTQRLPYYIGLPLLALILIFWTKIPTILRITLTLIVAILFAWGAYMGAFHSGVEWGFWAGPSSCTGLSEGLNFDALNSINDVKIIPCDQPQFRFLGISFAGYNALISSLIVIFLLLSANGQYKSK
jgi:disulfide bond formation protein DsbB